MQYISWNVLSVIGWIALLAIHSVNANSAGTPVCTDGNAGTTAGSPHVGGGQSLSDFGVTVTLGGTAITPGTAATIVPGTATELVVSGGSWKGIFVRLGAVDGQDLTGALTFTTADLQNVASCVAPAAVGVTHVNSIDKTSISTTITVPAGNINMDITIVPLLAEHRYSRFQLSAVAAVPTTAAPVAAVTPAPVVAPVAPVTPAPVAPVTPAPVAPVTPAPVAPVTPAPVVVVTPAPVTPAPVTPAPVVITPAPVPVPVTPAPVVVPIATPAPSAPPVPVADKPTIPPSRRHDTPPSLKKSGNKQDSSTSYTASTSTHTYVDPNVAAAIVQAATIPDAIVTTTTVDDDKKTKTSFIKHLRSFATGDF